MYMILTKGAIMLTIFLRTNVLKVSCLRQYNFPLVFASPWRRDGIALFSTTQSATPPENETQPSERKYEKPVDWLPFAWHRRPMFNIFEQSGDAVKTNIVDPSLCKPDFELSEELKSANEHVKKTFSLSTASEAEIKEAHRRQLLKRIQRHPLDFDSLEVQIALRTLRVRSLFDHSRRVKKDVRGSRTLLSIAIMKRNELLKKLRLIDNDRFCWVLKELQLEFTPRPLKFHYEKYCKKWDLRRLTKEYCQKTIADKKAAYHETLKEQQQAFLKEKKETLAWIEKEEKALNS